MGLPYLQNENYWVKDYLELTYIIKDATEAIMVNPESDQVNKWLDQRNDAVTVLYNRRNQMI